MSKPRRELRTITLQDGTSHTIWVTVYPLGYGEPPRDRPSTHFRLGSVPTNPREHARALAEATRTSRAKFPRRSR